MIWSQRSERSSSRQQGQALVEFAVVVPVIVMVLLFAIWFYELVFIKLKVQEATRFAVWEATSLPLHDYGQKQSLLEQGLGMGAGGQTDIYGDLMGMAGMGKIDITLPGGSKVGSSATINKYMNKVRDRLPPLVRIQLETVELYANLDSGSRTALDQLGTDNTLLASSFTPPQVLLMNRQEQTVPGGSVVNMVVNVVGTVVDLISALSFKSKNPVAYSMIAMGKGLGGARGSRLWGHRSWQFNKRGYICGSVSVVVRNEWFQSGIANMILPNPYVVIKEQPKSFYDHCLLADSWKLHDGSAVDGSPVSSKNVSLWEKISKGVKGEHGFQTQLDRMYFQDTATRAVLKGFIGTFYGAAQAQLSMAGASINTVGRGPKLKDMTRAVVVSKPYSGGSFAKVEGRVSQKQDDGTRYYDTAPVGSSVHSRIDEYRKTLKNRGEYFMGCKGEMKLGCPSSTLSQDNPFGDFVNR